MKTPAFYQLHHANADALRAELVSGLTAQTALGGAHVSPKFLYDTLGSRLFEAITELPEYYPTRTEATIFATHQAAIATLLPAGGCLIDLGAGSCAKAARLFSTWAPARYVAVDISVDFLRSALESLQRQFPAMDMVGVGLDFSAELALPPEAFGSDLQHANGSVVASPRVLFYPGSSIGNFTPVQALAFLKQVHCACGKAEQSGLLIGVDLVKDPDELVAAYDDALGVTAAFNRNVISNINRCVGSDMRLADWTHLALFDTQQSCIEMHLVAQRALKVQWPGGSRQFAQGERLHTENSYKWTVSGFTQLLRDAGFAAPTVWTDAPEAADGRFAVLWAPAAAA